MDFCDSRAQSLAAWARAFLSQQSIWPQPTGELAPVSVDASFRRYFRLPLAQGSVILMDAPPEKENSEPFVRIAGMLAKAGIAVPEIISVDLNQGFMMLSDQGNETYLHVLTADNADALFTDAIAALVAMQAKTSTESLPSYDVALLTRELELFPEWYVGKHLGITFNDEQKALWADVSQLLIESALKQSRVFVHRDFMPRNLMRTTPNPGVLDFQDAVQGPVSYDPICLFKDAFISWPEDKVVQWLTQYWAQAKAAGVAVPEDFEAFYRDADLMGAHRHIKVIGIFARICHRDGKPKYLTDVPRFFSYLEGVIARRAELAPLAKLLASLPKA